MPLTRRSFIQRLGVAGVNDLWVTEQDRLVVKSSIPSRDLEYVLASATGSWQ